MATNVLQNRPQAQDPETGGVNLFRKPKNISTSRGILRSLAQGLTFGFADEIVAAMVASVAAATGDEFSKVYREVVFAEREGLDDFAEENPATSVGLEIAGGVATGGVAGASRPFLASVVGGGLFGAGKAENLEDVPVDVAEGAAVGAAGFGLFKGAQTGISRIANSRAGRIIKKAGKRTGKTSEQLSDQIKELGPEARLADVLPELTEDVAQIPGARQVIEDFMEARAGGHQARLLGSLQQLTRSSKGYWSSIFELESKRAMDAKPLYDDAFDAGVNYNKDIAEHVSKLRDAFPKAWQSAKKLAGLEGDALPDEIPPTLNLRQLDWFKRGVDAEIANAGKKRPSIAAAGRRVKNAMVDELDRQNPQYKAARAAWAGPSAMMDAQEAGRNILKTDFELSAKEVGKLTESEREAFVIGAVRAVRDKILSVGGGRDVSKSFRPILQERLRPAFPDDNSFNQFIKTLDNESTFMAVRNQALGGSPTAKRQLGAQDLAAPLFMMASGRTELAAGEIIRKLMAGRNRLSEGSATDVARILVSERIAPERIRRVLEGRVPKEQLNRIIASLSVGASAGIFAE